jgi:hypothetical protein
MSEWCELLTLAIAVMYADVRTRARSRDDEDPER